MRLVPLPSLAHDRVYFVMETGQWQLQLSQHKYLLQEHINYMDNQSQSNRDFRRGGRVASVDDTYRVSAVAPLLT